MKEHYTSREEETKTTRRKEARKERPAGEVYERPYMCCDNATAVVT